MSTLSTVGLGLGLVVIFLSGFRLSRAGRPYAGLLLTVHKLVAIAAFLFLIVTLVQSSRASPLSAAVWNGGLVSGLGFLGLIVSGGMLSANPEAPPVYARLHRVAPYITLLSTAFTLYLAGR